MFSEITQTHYVVLFIAILFISGVITTKFSARLGVPALVLFIGIGMLIGSDALGIVYFNNAWMAQIIGVFALIIILFEGGLQTDWPTLRPIIKPALSLATLGVFITTLLVAVAAKYILAIDWELALLFGAIVGSTDAAAVFAVLKDQPIQKRIGATLEAESGSNDPMAVFLTVSMIEWITNPATNALLLVLTFFLQMGLGLLLGYLFGKLTVAALNRINLDSSGLYPLFAIAFALLTYGITASLNGSGLLAVYILAIIIGNADIAYRYSVFRFSEGFAWMMQILMFVILGLLVFPSDLFTWEIILQGLAVSVVLIAIARPVAVFISTFKMNFKAKELLFLSWAGLKGAVPIVLATFPLLADVTGSQQIFNVVFFVVLTSCLIQGTTIPVLAKKLALFGPKKTPPMHTLELISLGKANAEMVEYQIDSDHGVIGKTLNDIPFPDDTLVNGIIRDGQLITPSGDTYIHSGDLLYILTSRKTKKSLKKLLDSKA
ncbi:potassium/proton antiporter [Paraliobacillus ryukyuensis]|uniref:potassium/proton antiporter n=1 Tax=Paraliobacillus ryukyuensis TaxID=200904 RepID=UPI0009A76D88|nr:potassium/proton antiporter [Paraliobacillus ryukyuensis]